MTPHKQYEDMLFISWVIFFSFLLEYWGTVGLFHVKLNQRNFNFERTFSLTKDCQIAVYVIALLGIAGALKE